MNVYIYGAIAAVLLGLGFTAGKAYERTEVDAMVDHSNQQAIARLKTINDENARLKATIDSLSGIRSGLEMKLADALANVRTETVTRTIWRDREAQNPSCDAWLSAPVPCRLRADDAGRGGATGARQGPAP